MRPNKAQRIARAAQENDNMLAQQIATLSLAIESIETLLIAEGIIADGDVTAQLKALIELKQRHLEKKA